MAHCLLTKFLGFASIASGLATIAQHGTPSEQAKYGLQPFRIDLSAGVPLMLSRVDDTLLPSKPEYPALGDSAGIDLAVLKSLKKQWLEDFDWEKEQALMNNLAWFHHYTTELEGLTIHFVHEKSADPDAIPIMMNHGWPGSFLELTTIAKNLTQPAKTSSGKPISFHVVIPSLPGFAFSSAPPANWTQIDTARVCHTLMTEVLGYKTFATHGTDWGAAVSYTLYDGYNTSTRAAHFAFLPFLPLTTPQLAAANITLNSELEREEATNHDAWEATGNGYFVEQTTKPNTIGLALWDSPLGQLSWIGEKFLNWSDPRAGTGPSLLTHNEILTSVSLYYLTRSFTSSVFMYYQNVNTGFRSEYTKARTDAPMVFSAFRYNVGFWPPVLAAKVGNLVLYRNHDFGGHFPGLDNPPALLEDIREIGNHWNEDLSLSSKLV